MDQKRLDEFKEVAELLLNGDADASKQYEEPYVEEHPSDPDDPSAGTTCVVCVGGHEPFALVPPCEGQTMRAEADAIAKAGWIILELIAEIERGYQALAINGVPQCRAKSVSNGIGVLALRLEKLELPRPRIVAVHECIKRSDARARYLILPAGMDLAAEHVKQVEWHSDVYLPACRLGKPIQHITLFDWLKERGAREPTRHELAIVEDD